MRNVISKSKGFKLALITTAVSTVVFSNVSVAALVDANSATTPSMQGYAPYLPSVGARYVNKNLDDAGSDRPLIGDIIEVPTFLLDEDWYTYRDGNATNKDPSFEGDDEYKNDPSKTKGLPPYLASQDLDKDNAKNGRDREGQYLGQKVSVKWYMIKEKSSSDTLYYWSDNISFLDGDTFLEKAAALDLVANPSALEQLFIDWENEKASDADDGKKHKIVRSWDDIEVIPDVTDDGSELNGINEDYYIPMSNGGEESLALRIPPQAGNKRIGFVITPESRTGDPARGAPLRVADLNFFWGQKPNTKPGDVCENPIKPGEDDGVDLDSSCNTDLGGTPVKPNENGPGGVVGLRQYMVNIRWSEDGSGIPKFSKAGQPIDPIVGAHPDAMFPVTNAVYYAEIAIINKDNDEAIDASTPNPFSAPVNNQFYRLLSNDVNGANERDTVTWELTRWEFPVDGNGIVGIDRTQATETGDKLTLNWGEYKDKTDAEQVKSFIYLACSETTLQQINDGDLTLAQAADDATNPDGKACNPFTDHAFRTQVNNDTALTFWAGINNTISQGTTDLSLFPEQSEQLMKLQVKFKYDSEGITGTNP